MKHKSNLKIILVTVILLISFSGCSFLNKSEQSSDVKNKSMAEKTQEDANLKGDVLSINGDEVTIAKVADEGNGNSSSPKLGSKIASKDMKKFKLTENTKIIIRNSYGNEGTGKGGRSEDKTGLRDDIKYGSFVEVWTEKDEETVARTVRVSIFKK